MNYLDPNADPTIDPNTGLPYGALPAVAADPTAADTSGGVQRRKVTTQDYSTDGGDYTPPPQASTQDAAPPVTQAPTVARVALPDSTQNNASGGDIAAVQGFYTKYTGRAANPGDPETWLSGGYGYGTDLATIENAIRNSPEAQAYAKSQGGSGATSPYGPMPTGFDPSRFGVDAKYYAPGEHGPGQPAMIGLPNGYYVQNSDGTWGALNPRGPEGSSGGGSGSGGITFPGFPTYAPPTPFTPSPLNGPTQPLADDPFSKSIQDGIKQAMDAAAARLHSTPQQRATAMEGARMPYEMARKVQLNNADADLANRGLLGEQGHQSGLQADAIGRIETNLAPAYTGAVSNAMSLLDQSEQQAITQLLQGASTGTQRQQVLSDVALRELDENRLWNQFLAQNALDKDKAMWDLQQGQGQQLLTLFSLYLQRARDAANGYV